MLRMKYARPLLALFLSLMILCGTFIAAFGEDEEPATTSTTVASEEKSDKSDSDKDGDKSTTKKDSDQEDEKSSTKKSDKDDSDKSTTKKSEDKEEPSEDESSTAKEDESTTEPTTEEPTTEAPKEPDFPADYTGIALTTYDGVEAWWRVVNGKVQPKATGVYSNQYGWWYVKNGKVDFDHYGVENNQFGWWRIEGGKVNFKANSIYSNRFGWWKCKDGKVDFSYTGVASNPYGWWRVKNGKVDFNAEGAYKNEFGTWYVKGGKVDFKKTGTVVKGKTSYTVKHGKVLGTTIKVPLVNQLPNYPTGCEAASATMVLKYWGYDINLAKMVNAIPRENLRTVDGKRYGPRITEKFVGDPRSGYTSKNPGYGAFAPVVSKSMNNIISAQHGKQKAYNKTGTAFGDLLPYIDEGKPVIVWSTYNMKTPSTVNSWYIATPTGPEYFSYPRGTHVCVLVGYDQKNIYLADPYGASTKTFSRSAFNDKYKLLGRQAVVVQ